MTTDQLKKWNVWLTIVLVLLIIWSIYAGFRLNRALGHLGELNAWLEKVRVVLPPHDPPVGNPPSPPPKLF